MDYKEKVIALLSNKELSKEQKEKLENIFPELKESEDERIRKAIMSCCIDHGSKYKYLGVSMEEMGNWLEKQGGNLVKNGYTNNKDFIKYADEYSHEIWHKLMDNFKNIKDYHIGCNDVSDIVLNAIIDTCNWLEKQREQKPADNVEPNFHKGDWITNGDYTWKIVEVKPLDYILLSQDGNIVDDTISYVDEYFHLWSIQDAKDGDVLASEDKDKIFLYNGKLDLRGRARAYCGIYKTYDGLRFTKCAVGNPFTYKEPHPATKEQRELLFQKMKEAGYEWDNHRKELKRIEAVSIESENESISKDIVAFFVF